VSKLDKLLDFVVGRLFRAGVKEDTTQEQEQMKKYEEGVKQIKEHNRQVKSDWEGESTPTPTPQSSPEEGGLGGFAADMPEDAIKNLILGAAERYKVDPALLAAVLYQESRFNPQAIGDTDPNDIGIGQINLPSHPNVTREQALDPAFAIPFAAQKLAGDIKHFDDVNRGVAAYNVGRGGANVQGPEPFGGGPRGQTYINNVSRNLDPEKLRALGLITSLE